MRNILYLVLIAATVNIVGCSEKPHQTISYYEQHDNERAEMLKWCNDDSSRGNEADCLNANKAQENHMLSGKTPSRSSTFHFKPTK